MGRSITAFITTTIASYCDKKKQGMGGRGGGDRTKSKDLVRLSLFMRDIERNNITYFMPPSNALIGPLFSYVMYELNSPIGPDNLIIWAASSKTVPSSTHRMCGLTSSCPCAKPHPDICSLLKHSLVFNDSICGQKRCDCANAQADLSVPCLHMLVTRFRMRGQYSLYPN